MVINSMQTAMNTALVNEGADTQGITHDGGRSLRALGDAVHALARLTQIGVWDWGSRASRAINAGRDRAATTLSIVERATGLVEHAGAAATKAWARYEHVLFGLAAGHESHRAFALGHEVAHTPLSHRHEHPFADAGIEEGVVVRGVLPVDEQRVLVIAHIDADVEHAEPHRLAMGVAFGFVARSAARLWGSSAGGPQWLTRAESRVLDYLAVGMTESDAAMVMERSVSTVHDHVKAIHRKAGVSTRGELVALAGGLMFHPQTLGEPAER